MLPSSGALRADDNPLRTLTHAQRAEPLAPGTALLRGGRIAAVVIDVDDEPACTSDHVAAAVDAVCRLAQARRMSHVCLPLLGVTHGRLPAAAAASAIGRGVARAPLEGAATRLSLVVEPALCALVAAQLAGALTPA
jgi:hypothetical protein